MIGIGIGDAIANVIKLIFPRPTNNLYFAELIGGVGEVAIYNPFTILQ